MTNDRNLLAHLKNDALFGSLDDAVLDALIADRRCSVATYHSGETVYSDRDFRRALGLILAGTVEVHRVGQSQPVLLQQLSEGRLFGVAALFSEDESYVSVLTATSETTVFFLPAEVCEELLTRHPAFALRYIRFLSDRIRFLNRRIASLAAGGAEGKLAQYLLQTEGKVSPNRVQLASALGIGRASLYRALDDLSEKGLIALDGKSITVLHPKGLRRLL